MTFELRRAIAADAPDLIEIRARAICAHAANHYSDVQRRIWVANVTCERLRRQISDPASAIVVACSGDAITGFVQVREDVIWGLYVAPEFWNRAAARLLTRAAEGAAYARNVSRLWLSASLNAVGFYAHVGYYADSRFWFKMTGGGHTTDFEAVAMWKNLTASVSGTPEELFSWRTGGGIV